MVQTKIWQMTLFRNLILFTDHYGNLQEMLEMASFLKYLHLYLRVSGAGFTWYILCKAAVKRTAEPTLKMKVENAVFCILQLKNRTNSSLPFIGDSQVTCCIIEHHFLCRTCRQYRTTLLDVSADVYGIRLIQTQFR
jgi:hypothetical protein